MIELNSQPATLTLTHKHILLLLLLHSTSMRNACLCNSPWERSACAPFPRAVLLALSSLAINFKNSPRSLYLLIYHVGSVGCASYAYWSRAIVTHTQHTHAAHTSYCCRCVFVYLRTILAVHAVWLPDHPPTTPLGALIAILCAYCAKINCILSWAVIEKWL